MRKIVVGILLSMWTTVVLPATICAHEVKYEVKIGLLYHDIAPVWGNTKIEKGVDLNAEILLGMGNFRPHIGLSINIHGYTSRAYVGYSCHIGGDLFGAVSLGGAYIIDYVRRLGSPVLFRIAGEIGYQLGRHSVSVILDHISNANLAEHNQGLDLLGIRYGWRW